MNAPVAESVLSQLRYPEHFPKNHKLAGGKRMTPSGQDEVAKGDQGGVPSIDLLSHWMHQDNAAWRAIGWIIPIEAGVLTGAIARPGLPGLLLVLLGTFFIVALAMYARKCFKDRDVNKNLIDLLRPLGFQLGEKTKDWEKGRFWLRWALWVLLISNLLLAALETCKCANWLPGITSAFFR